jgi:dUTP pyrophosphatase|tara:strand:- start:904 stop:1605 length:702 start_codon:yes stop_codon:yes gene_type:complete
MMDNSEEFKKESKELEDLYKELDKYEKIQQELNNASSTENLQDLGDIKDIINLLSNTVQAPAATTESVNNYDELVKSYESLKYNFNVVTKFTNGSNNPDPEYSREGDSGFDLRAYLSESITLKPLERKLIPTGLRFELSANTELQVRPRSGMALKYGISVLNTPGTVDEGYRGEVGIIAVNLSNDDYTIEPGERIAQGVIMNVVGQRITKLIKTETLTESERADGGFGSTGKK